MTDGLRRNTEKLFDERGHIFLLALDHAQSGVMSGLENTPELMKALAGAPLDGFILNIGLAANLARAPFLRKKLLLRTSFGGSSLAEAYAPAHRNHVSPETALAVGADAVLMMAVVGGEDYKSLQTLAADIDAFHQYSIPVVVEILASEFPKTATFDIQFHGSRIAAELGADAVKVFYVDNFERVVNCCPVPVILAGGPKDRDIGAVARHAVECGARGFAFGRNIFQAEDPLAVIRSLREVLG
jgi:class I fructose-bisphosphate aldolase/fructose-bisphosphate aldolase/2-amino-3,7-dideoxy-D-threo-hept-6-ulosonate synthase